MQSQSTTRRTKVKNHPGVYYRDTPAGRRYEITFVDELGRRRWSVVDGNLAAADAAREEKRRRRRDGETVQPDKVRLCDFAASWLDGQAQLKASTRALYGHRIARQLLPTLGRLYVHEIRKDDVTGLIARLTREGLSPYTVRGVVMLLGAMLTDALDRGMVRANVVSQLKDKEKPKRGNREMRILSAAEIPRVIAAADDRYRVLIATAVFTGLRQGELLGLRWQDVDLDEARLRVRHQLDRNGRLSAPKTDTSKRTVTLFPSLVEMLREHRREALARGHASPESFVFASEVGTPLHFRNVGRRGLDTALARAGIDGTPKLRFHDLRHTFASLLIAQGATILWVSRQMGHSKPSITLDVYGHLFQAEEHEQRHSDRMEAAFGTVLETTGGDRRGEASGAEDGIAAPVLKLATRGD